MYYSTVAVVRAKYLRINTARERNIQHKFQSKRRLGAYTYLLKMFQFSSHPLVHLHSTNESTTSMSNIFWLKELKELIRIICETRT